MIQDISLTLLFVLANAFFVAAEFAIVKVRASQIEIKARAGGSIAKIAKNLIHHLDAYLSATQLGITLASLGLGWIGESVVSKLIMNAIALFGLTITPELAHKIALPTAFALITFMHIVFGELIPKSIAIQYSEKVTLTIALPLRFFYFLFRPIIWTLNEIANAFIKAVGLQVQKSGEGELHSADELLYIIEESSKSGLIDAAEHKLIENVFEFSEIPVKQIMVPRNNIVAVAESSPIEDLVEVFLEEGYSRMPVYRKTIDNIIGEIYAKDMISLLANRHLIILHDIIRPAFFVQEEMMIDDLLKDLQKEHTHLAVVLNEFGGTAGIVTLEDIMEELVGEIQDEYDEEQPNVTQIADNSYSITATLAVADLNEILDAPLPESDDYETVGGLITAFLGAIPEEGTIFEYSGYTFEILKRTNKMIEKVKLTYSGSTEVDE